QQFAAASTINATLPAASIEGGAKPGTGLVSDCMKCEQRLAHAPVAPLSQILERQFSALAKSLPLLCQKLWERSFPIFDPHAPLRGGLFNNLGPTRNAIRRPIEPPRWR